MTDKSAADVLEEAADLLLIHGRCRGRAFDDDGRLCVIGAINHAGLNLRLPRAVTPASDALRSWLNKHEVANAQVAHSVFCPVVWNDHPETTDDEVRDTLLLVAKNLRNAS